MIEHVLIGAAILLLLSVAASKASDQLGIPSLLLFLLIGMLAGSEGPGGIYFDDAQLAQSVGIVALIFILFAGGLETNYTRIKRGNRAWHSSRNCRSIADRSPCGWLFHSCIGLELPGGLAAGGNRLLDRRDCRLLFAGLKGDQSKRGSKTAY